MFRVLESQSENESSCYFEWNLEGGANDRASSSDNSQQKLEFRAVVVTSAGSLSFYENNQYKEGGYVDGLWNFDEITKFEARTSNSLVLKKSDGTVVVSCTESTEVRQEDDHLKLKAELSISILKHIKRMQPITVPNSDVDYCKQLEGVETKLTTLENNLIEINQNYLDFKTAVVNALKGLPKNKINERGLVIGKGVDKVAVAHEFISNLQNALDTC